MVAERVGARQSQALLDETNDLNPFRSGFRPVYRNEPALVSLMDDDFYWEKDTGENVNLLFLFDLSVVFDPIGQLESTGPSGLQFAPENLLFRLNASKCPSAQNLIHSCSNSVVKTRDCRVRTGKTSKSLNELYVEWVLEVEFYHIPWTDFCSGHGRMGERILAISTPLSFSAELSDIPKKPPRLKIQNCRILELEGRPPRFI